MRKDIPHAERTYLAVPYAERQEAKALGVHWDAVKKAWYVGSEADREMGTETSTCTDAGPTGGIRRGAARNRGGRRRRPPDHERRSAADSCRER
jgi:putative DNA primase/helicase